VFDGIGQILFFSIQFFFRFFFFFFAVRRPGWEEWLARVFSKKSSVTDGHEIEGAVATPPGCRTNKLEESGFLKVAHPHPRFGEKTTNVF